MPTGTVKWFNATKGYGFIGPDDGSSDVFVHVSAVEQVGLGTLGERQTITFATRSGRDGRPSAEDLSLAPTTDDDGGDDGERAPHDAARDTGTVKWFNTAKGYGFIEPEDGLRDVFVHANAVERAGLGTLRERQRLSYELRPGRGSKSSAENLSAAD